MARSTRIHRPGDLHYLVLRSNAGRHVFAHPADFSEFARLVERHAAACDIRVLAFCWTPDAAHLVLQVSSTPVGKFVQRVAGQHAQRINRHAGVRGHVFRQRYRAAVVTESQLPLVLRHVHLMPVRLGLAADPAEYLWSSHRVYLGVQSFPWVAVEPVLHVLESSAQSGIEAYRQLIRDALARRATPAVAQGAASRADEEREFWRSLMPVARRTAGDPGALDRLTEQVAARLSVGSDELKSRSRRRVLSLGRAVVAWHATRSGIARLSEVARHLGRHPSTLSIAIERYRRGSPHLFGEPFSESVTEGLPRSTPPSED